MYDDAWVFDLGHTDLSVVDEVMLVTQFQH